MYRVHLRAPRPVRAFALLLGLVFLTSLPVHARLYKWTDADGNTIYSQTPPPSDAKTGHTELNGRGLKLKQVDAPLTAAERAAQEAKAKQEAETAALIAMEAQEDAALLKSFPSLGALEDARDFRLATLDQKIRYINSRRTDANDRLYVNQDRIANFRRKKLDIPEQLVVEKITLDRDIAKMGEQVATMELERAVVAAGFAADRARYLRIMAERARQSGG